MWMQAQPLLNDDLDALYTLYSQGNYAGDWGNGTQSRPYKIRTAKQLNSLSNVVNAGFTQSGKWFIQTGDIDLSAYDNWVPIGTNANRFSGNYNGNGYSIYNIKCQAVSAGFFGYATGTLRNINIKIGLIVGFSDNATSFAGGICGNIFGASVIGCVSDTTIKTIQGGARNSYASGIVGMGLESVENNIVDCINLSSVLTEGDTTGPVVVSSGICRRSGIAGTTLNIVRCFNAGAITNTTVNGAPNAISSNATSITNCYFDNQTSIATNATATGRTTANSQGSDALTEANKLQNLGAGWAETNGYPMPKRFIERIGL